jgi:hypothetical protein
MKSLFLAGILLVLPFTIFAQSSDQKKAPPKPPTGPASQPIETEKISAPAATPAPIDARTGMTGYLEPEQVKALLHKIWLAEYRVNDLLEQVHPDHWKMADNTRKSFGQSLEGLHKAMSNEEDWRTQFDARPDSLYLGFQTYVAINAILPRLDGLSRSIAQYENPSFGAQYSQAGNQLFDLQQALQPHLAFLLKNQDGMLYAAQTNLASCQNELGFAEHDKEGHATPMKNIVPVFKGHRRTAHAAAPAGEAKKAEPKGKMSAKPATNPTNKTQKN